MAVQQVDNESKMTIQVNVGTSSDPSYKNRIFNYINAQTSDAVFYECASSLAGLQTDTLNAIKRTNTFTLENE